MVAVGWITTSVTGIVGVAGAVGLAGLCVLVGFGIAVGASPTGLSTFFIYVLATSYRQATRLLIAGTCDSKTTNRRAPAPMNRTLRFNMRKSVPEEYETYLIESNSNQKYMSRRHGVSRRRRIPGQLNLLVQLSWRPFVSLRVTYCLLCLHMHKLFPAGTVSRPCVSCSHPSGLRLDR